jgi:hypothetical protein
VLCDIMCDISNLFRHIFHVISALSALNIFHACALNICCFPYHISADGGGGE